MAGKYHPLTASLARQSADEVTLTFAQIEVILGAPLPVSAWTPSWWANHSDAPHVRAWLDTGWQVASMDRTKGVVTFEWGKERPPVPEGPPPDGEYLTPQQAATELDATYQAVIAWLHRRKITGVRRGRHWWIPRAEVERLRHAWPNGHLWR